MPTPSNALNISATGLVKFDGVSAFSAVTTTNHNTLIGAASNGITNLVPSATSGIPIISQGASSDPVFGTMVVAGGGTGIATATPYAVLAGGTTSTGAFQSLTSGTTTQVVTSNGNASLPTYVKSNTVGSWQFLSSQNASASVNIDFNSLLSATYTNYVVIYSNVVTSTSANLRFQVSTNNGVSFLGSGYTGGYVAYQYNSVGFSNNSATNLVFLTPNYNAAHGAAGRINLRNIGNGQQFLVDGMTTYGNTAGTSTFLSQIVAMNSATNVNSIRFAISTGTMTTGTFTLYGVLE